MAPNNVFCTKSWGRCFALVPLHKDLSFVQQRPQKSLDIPIERFFASLRFEQREKLEQLGIEIGFFD